MTTAVVISLDPVPDPLAVLGRFADRGSPILLHSAAPGHPLSRYSYLAANPVATLLRDADGWSEVAGVIRQSLASPGAVLPELPPFQGGWAGWFGYELGRAFDTMQCASGEGSGAPDVALALYDWVIAWDHAVDRAWLVSTGIDAGGDRDPDRAAQRARTVFETVAGIGSTPPASRAGQPRGESVTRADFTPDEYRTAVARVVEHVRAGDIFQANISQRFIREFTADPLELYRALVARSPAPMAAFVAHLPHHALSVSPERFVRFTPTTREIETRPIKGTRPRGSTAVEDAALAHDLSSSVKDRAENVMIVDLLRNDLARVAVTGTVETPSVCALETHPTVHHLVSTVTAQLRPGLDALDLLAATFPGGSVTGAPKIRAMEVIASIEPVRRGVYCGAIGWIGLDGALDTSIAIRTITLDGHDASYHAGGGVTALSSPEGEHLETLDKARALAAALEEVG
ncbi:MAG: aminodeoxychorismate synthase component I [Gemmatimonadales bacterium]